MKKTVVGLIVAVLLVATFGQGVSASTEADVTLNGEIIPVILDISIPTSISFTIDPNQPQGQKFVAPTLQVSNNTPAPIDVSVTKFTLSANSISQGWQDVPTNHFDRWDNLNVLESKNLSLNMRSADGWEIKYNDSVIDTRSSFPMKIGTIGSKDNARFSFDAKHGNAFPIATQLEYNVSLLIELTDGE